MIESLFYVESKESKKYTKEATGRLWFKGQLSVHSARHWLCLAFPYLRSHHVHPYLMLYPTWSPYLSRCKEGKKDICWQEPESINRSLSAESRGWRGWSKLEVVGPRGPVYIDIHQGSSYYIRDSREAVILGVWARCSDCEQIQCALWEDPESRGFQDPQNANCTQAGRRQAPTSQTLCSRQASLLPTLLYECTQARES